jgi:beta-lactamase class D
MDSNRAVGWYVGWVERSDGAVIFAACIPTERAKEDGDAIFNQRKPIAIAILKALGVID